MIVIITATNDIHSHIMAGEGAVFPTIVYTIFTSNSNYRYYNRLTVS